MKKVFLFLYFFTSHCVFAMDISSRKICDLRKIYVKYVVGESPVRKLIDFTSPLGHEDAESGIKYLGAEDRFLLFDASRGAQFDCVDNLGKELSQVKLVVESYTNHLLSIKFFSSKDKWQSFDGECVKLYAGPQKVVSSGQEYCVSLYPDDE